MRDGCGGLPLQETDKLGGRLEQLFDAPGHGQTLAGTLGLGAVCGAQERKIRRRGRESWRRLLSRVSLCGENGTISALPVAKCGIKWLQNRLNKLNAVNPKQLVSVVFKKKTRFLDSRIDW